MKIFLFLYILNRSKIINIKIDKVTFTIKMNLNTIPLSAAPLNASSLSTASLNAIPLNSFLNKYGSDTTTNFDLKKIAKDLQIKIHIIMCDEINNYSQRSDSSGDLDKDGRSPTFGENLIINLQTSKEKGSHWVLCSKKFKIYFDSYGVVPIKNIDTYLDKSSFIYNTIQVQKINTKICGQLCLFVLDKL